MTNNDDNIALLLRNEAEDLAREATALRTKGGGHPQTQMTKLFNHEAEKLEAQVERLNELAEALAGRQVKVVDEYLAVKTIEVAIRDEQDMAKRDGEPGSPLRTAQLVWEDMKKKGAIR